MPFIESSQSTKTKMNLGNVSNPVLIGIAALVVVALLLLGQNVYHMIVDDAFSVVSDSEKQESSEIKASDSDESEANTNSDSIKEATSSKESEESNSSVVVFVSGSVEHPGVYTLPQGSRVQDAVNAAGGFSEGACTDAVNLARVLCDEEQVAIISQEEANNAETLRDAASSSSSNQSSVSASGSLVNINTASSSELESLPGIGQATASKIIENREDSGPFFSPEDIKRVSGIGDKKYEALKDLICV